MIRSSTDVAIAGDNRRPICTRCETKGLNCKPVQKKAVFRHGSTANLDTSFSQGQIWVNSKPRNWWSARHSTATAENEPTPALPTGPNRETAIPWSTSNEAISERLSTTISVQFPNRAQNASAAGRSPGSTSVVASSSPAFSPLTSHAHPDERHAWLAIVRPNSSFHNDSSIESWGVSSSTADDSLSPSCGNQSALTVSESVQESCLLRYFIEELSPWV